ncbi:DUF4180 domain-containing protein [Herbaspirillum seropedicae]|uniref:Cytosolic protein n=1 Tax=Herbaspirillum seropedicae (strain SmR1) TaxID=757424 RepID=D8IQG0_HERSS|nr:DUF4180 domain-containing protein [Herbaspirillum seropedicae]ADJ65072.1 cytosolic protein [Herbaspirillum seropedicae SmR1]AKN66945.1 hypothetical protein ACP92_17920 [Herbaspirillum seropedicae]NQE28044.1 hypothetical protein [Herbaspirillum seropedicae]UMU22942.1 DUF4180 domain-containing protein [Herbaspirillum seropedicae]
MRSVIISMGPVRILHCPAQEGRIASEGDTDSLLSAAWEHCVQLVAIDASCLDESFFHLSSGLAGRLVQRFVNYRMPLAILGQLGRHLDASRALTDYVRESNRGNTVWFLDHFADLESRLASNALAPPRPSW